MGNVEILKEFSHEQIENALRAIEYARQHAFRRAEEETRGKLIGPLEQYIIKVSEGILEELSGWAYKAQQPYNDEEIKKIRDIFDSYANRVINHIKQYVPDNSIPSELLIAEDLKNLEQRMKDLAGKVNGSPITLAQLAEVLAGIKHEGSHEYVCGVEITQDHQRWLREVRSKWEYIAYGGGFLIAMAHDPEELKAGLLPYGLNAAIISIIKDGKPNEELDEDEML